MNKWLVIRTAYFLYYSQSQIPLEANRIFWCYIDANISKIKFGITTAPPDKQFETLTEPYPNGFSSYCATEVSKTDQVPHLVIPRHHPKSKLFQSPGISGHVYLFQSVPTLWSFVLLLPSLHAIFLSEHRTPVSLFLSSILFSVLSQNSLSPAGCNWKIVLS